MALAVEKRLVLRHTRLQLLHLSSESSRIQRLALTDSDKKKRVSDSDGLARIESDSDGL